MKHSDCFKGKSHNIAILGLALLLCGACVKHDELPFSGIVVDNCPCTSQAFGGDFGSSINPGGFLVILDEPVTDKNGNTVNDSILLYEPTTRIKLDNHIHGTFYLQANYSKANCAYHCYKGVPEGVFTDIVVDK